MESSTSLKSTAVSMSWVMALALSIACASSAPPRDEGADAPPPSVEVPRLTRATCKGDDTKLAAARRTVGADEADKGNGRVGRPAYRFWFHNENSRLEGLARFELKDLIQEGKRPAVLSFVASWCCPCIRELTALADRPKPMLESGAVYAIIVTDEEPGPRDEMIRFLVEDLKVPFPIGVDYPGENKLQIGYGVESLPHTAVVSPKGEIVAVEVGYDEKKSQRRLLAAIRKARRGR